MTDQYEQSWQNQKTRIWRYAPLLLWMAFIFLASTGAFAGENTSRILRPFLLWLFPHVTEEQIAVIHLLIRKFAHFSEYAVLGFLAARAFAGSAQRLLREHWTTVSAILVVIYALLDEFHQSYVASRSASIFDSLIDIAGGLFALICFAYFRRTRRRKALSERAL
ncbi:MAG: VanZ family protein [Pyrinomonadaceae bacterium]